MKYIISGKNQSQDFWLLTLSGLAFSVIHQAQGGGRGLRGSDAKNQG